MALYWPPALSFASFCISISHYYTRITRYRTNCTSIFHSLISICAKLNITSAVVNVCLVSLSYTVWFFQPLYVFFSQSSLCLSIAYHLSFCIFIHFLCTLWWFGCPGPGTGCSCAPILLPGSGGPQRWKRTLANGVPCVYFDITQLHPSASSLTGRRHLPACSCVAVCVQLD